MKKLIVALLAATAYSSIFALNDTEVEALLQTTAQSIRSKLPQRINNSTTIVTVVAGPGRRFLYRIISDYSSSEWTPQTRTQSRRIAVNDYCTNPELEAYRSFGVTVSWQFSDVEGRHILTNTVSPSDCR